MAEYIEREALIGDLTAAMDHRGMGQVIGQTLIRYVKRQPAADVAPVVRCKDCKHRGWVQEPCHGRSVDCCKVWGCTLQDLELTFCSYGERKDGADHGKEKI
nr:MAG TPA: hypothetical protein [Caudoviricetes sp.]